MGKINLLGFTLIISLLILSGCARQATLGPDLRNVNKEFIEGPMWKNSKTCLALSGGGIRSALYSLGVMSILSKEKKLNSLDYISSVSGGGYASGYYYQKMYQRKENDQMDSGGDHAFLFGKEALEELNSSIEGEFMPMEEVGAIADIWTGFTSALINGYGIILSAIVQGPPPKSAARAIYQTRLERTFLGEDWAKPGYQNTPPLLKIGKMVEKHQLPKFVFNATIQGKEDKEKKTPRRDLIFSYGFIQSPGKIVKLDRSDFLDKDGKFISSKAIEDKISELKKKSKEGLKDEYILTGISRITGIRPLKPELTLGDVITTSGAAIGVPLDGYAGTLRDYSGIGLGHYEKVDADWFFSPNTLPSLMEDLRRI
jgi:hypothetical protein